MAIPACVRPMMFENSDAELRISIRGTSFLVDYRGRIFALTAKHNVLDFHPRQYRVPVALGSHRMLDYGQPYTCDRHGASFEDFVVIPIDQEGSRRAGFNPADAAILNTEGIDWPSVREVAVIGFPTENNDFEPGEAVIYGRPVVLRGVLNGQVADEGLRGVQIADPGGLASFAGVSGCPVFDLSPGSPNRLLGIVVQGSRDTSVSRLCHFLDVRVVPDLIATDDAARRASAT